MAQALLAASGVSTGCVVDIAFAIPQVPAAAQAQRKNQAEWLHESSRPHHLGGRIADVQRHRRMWLLFTDFTLAG